MSEYKKEFRYFTIFDYEKEQEYLSWMHECGWKFTMVYFPGIYCFEKCKPEKVIYQLDYNQEGRTHKAEYLQMFADCGWEYLLEFMGYSYFRKPAAEMKEDEGIFCDDDSRLDMMKRVFRGRMVPLLCIFLAVLLPQLSIQLTDKAWTQGAFRSSIFWLYLVLVVVYIGFFIRFAIYYLHFKNRRQ